MLVSLCLQVLKWKLFYCNTLNVKKIPFVLYSRRWWWRSSDNMPCKLFFFFLSFLACIVNKEWNLMSRRAKEEFVFFSLLSFQDSWRHKIESEKLLYVIILSNSSKPQDCNWITLIFIRLWSSLVFKVNCRTNKTKAIK